MDQPIIHFTTVLIAFLAIMNPIANAPVFVGVTEGLDAASRRGVALRAVLLAFVIVTLFCVGGRALFTAFGISLPAFRIAGGVLVALVGYHLLQGGPSPVHVPTDEDNLHSKGAAIGIAVSPLAMPLLAGPGTIATAMSFSAGADLADLLRITGAFACVCVLTLLAFLAGDAMVKVLGQNSIKVMSRLMGLILAVVGVQMLIDGIKGAFPGA